jgi:Zn-dependent oligopeptidase
MARRGWNLGYLSSGDVTQKLDPYFPFATALERWGQSFSSLGIRYRGATLTLDLLDRPGKYENGFMHGPGPAWQNGDRFTPARINFTANASPGQVGSGHRALETLFHEGGHAAHFSNIRMPSPCFSQEYAPTSVAFAETQSMFLDSFVETPAWQARYVRHENGKSLPWEIARENLVCKHPLRAWQLRAMLTVCYAEKALYEMSDAELQPSRVLAAVSEVEKRLQFLEEGARPVLSVPHLLAWESSAYYHGYVLAEMAVHQTRQFFMQRDGILADNPAIGPDLDRYYWAPGNSRTFFELVEGLTGKPFSAEATAEAIGRPLEETLSSAEIEFRQAAQGRDKPSPSGDFDLEATIRLVHGDETLGECQPGENLGELSEKFKTFLKKQHPG